MKVLVDYDNVPFQLKRQGPVYVLDRIMTALRGMLGQLGIRQLDFRLYGGWYENQIMSRAAQDLGTVLRGQFPKIFNLDHTNPPTPIRISATLAQSLEVLPGTVLTNTLRNVPVQKEFRCTRPSTIGCANLPCPIDALAGFLVSSVCPVAGCRFTPTAVLHKMEQKLVDTMMVADMIFLAHNGEVAVAIVSSDDDMWPGIISALLAGTELIHVQTQGLKQILPYKRNVVGKYQQLEI